jgi:DNA mismatch repair ATPase MutL
MPRMKKGILFLFILILFFQKNSILRTLYFAKTVIQHFQSKETNLITDLTIELTAAELQKFSSQRNEIFWNGTFYEIVSRESVNNGNIRLSLHTDHWETKIHEIIQDFNQPYSSTLPIKGIENLKWWLDEILGIYQCPTLFSANKLILIVDFPTMKYTKPLIGVEIPPPNL